MLTKLYNELDSHYLHLTIFLDEEPRYIAAFRTENEVKQYKRIVFGVNSAPEELQHTILGDIDRVLNIADDISMYGITIEHRDKVLPDVLQHLTQEGLTLKLPKCIFVQSAVKYYGCNFSNEGMRPTPSKIIAVKEAKRPCHAKGIKSFLRQANHLKRFIDDYSTITYPLRLLTLKNTHFK